MVSEPKDHILSPGSTGPKSQSTLYSQMYSINHLQNGHRVDNIISNIKGAEAAQGFKSKGSMPGKRARPKSNNIL